MIKMFVAGYVVLLSLSLFMIAAILALRLIAGDLAEVKAGLLQYGILLAIGFGSAAMAFLFDFVDD